MDNRGRACALVLLSSWLVSCGTDVPAPRLDTYLGRSASAATDVRQGLHSGSTAALVVISDSPDESARPFLSPRGREFLIQQVRAVLGEALPLAVTVVVPDVRTVVDGQGRLSVDAIAKTHGVDSVAVAVFSAMEREDPQPLALDGTRGGGGAMGRLPGTVTSVFALAELAVVEAAGTGEAVRSQGRTVLTLEELANGLTSNVFPVIYRGGGQQRIEAPRDPGEARDALRSLAFEEALRYAAYDLREAWKARRPVSAVR